MQAVWVTSGVVLVGTIVSSLVAAGPPGRIERKALAEELALLEKLDPTSDAARELDSIIRRRITRYHQRQDVGILAWLIPIGFISALFFFSEWAGTTWLPAIPGRAQWAESVLQVEQRLFAASMGAVLVTVIFRWLANWVHRSEFVRDMLAKPPSPFPLRSPKPGSRQTIQEPSAAEKSYEIGRS